MGGVDLSDQLRSYYKLGRSTKKWWKQCFYGLLNILVINCFISYKYIVDKNMNLFDFKMLLFKELTFNYYSRIRKLSYCVRLSNIEHKMSKRSTLRQCFVCANNNRTQNGAKFRTSYYCVECEKS